MNQVLLVDDDRGFSALAASALEREGFSVLLARSLHEARAALARHSPELVILDRRLPDGDGLSFLPELKAQLPHAVTMVVTAHGDIASAVDAIRAGAADYLAKPVELMDVVFKAKRSVEEIQLRERLHQAESELSNRKRLSPTRSPAMQSVVSMLERIAASPRSPVLLLGETGVGKEVAARYLHSQAAGETAPFVHINCAAVPEMLAESELFGHEKGAFTDARTARRGLVEMASGGTLFLDEIGELPLALQAKLLTFLDSGRFRRVGGSVEQTSLARVVAATNRDLAKEVSEGLFREDLWYRLSVFRVRIPPLRQRPEDIVPLAEATLNELRTELGRKNAQLGAAARERLLRYSFPGNIRELHNVLERALVLETTDVLALDVLEHPIAAQQSLEASSNVFVVRGGPISSEELERRYARHVLEQLGGKRLEAAKALGLSYPTFLKRIDDSSE